MTEQERLAKWVNELAGADHLQDRIEGRTALGQVTGGSYAEDYVGQIVAEEWIKDRKKVAELEAEAVISQACIDASRKSMAEDAIHIGQLEAAIERVKALPDQWRRAGSLMIDAERCLTDLEEALEGE